MFDRFVVCPILFVSQPNILKQNTELKEALEQSLQSNAHLQEQHQALRKEAVTAAVREAEAANEELSRQLHDALHGKEAAERALGQEQARYRYLGSFEALFNTKFAAFKEDMEESMQTLKDAALSCNGGV